MTLVLAMITVQSLLGALDNLWHHEITERLPSRPAARTELALHTVRELLYAVIFLGVGWLRWEGAWALVLAGILAIEIVVTLWDFLVEDATRRLPRLERILHTVLAINFGAILAVWAPELWRWLQAPTALTPVSYGLWSWLMTAFSAGVFAWSIRDLAAVVRLGVPEWQRRPLRAGMREGGARTVLVTGGTGFVGRALVRRLVEAGDRVIVLSRDAATAADRFGPLVETCGSLAALPARRRIDAVVNLAGEPLAGGLWTPARKRRFLDSRLAVTREVIALLGRLETRPAVLVSGSAIGWYGDRGDEALTEASTPGNGFTAELCRAWEAEAERATALGIRVCRLRIGLVLGADGGALPPMALGARLGLGTVMGSGAAFMSWIHREDLVRLILFAIDQPALEGPINAVAPEPLRSGAFMAALGAAFGRRVRLRLPAALLRAGLGGMAELFLASQRVRPDRALAAGFRFRFGAAPAALADLLGPPPIAGQSAPLTVYLNEACTICRTEMAGYARHAARHDSPVSFAPIGRSGGDLAAWGLRETDLRRRLYAVDRAGELRSGVAAFIALWSELPGYRRLARLAALPGLRQACELFYEGLCVPLLARWNRLASRPAGFDTPADGEA